MAMDAQAYNALVKTHVLYNMTNQVMREFREQTDVGDEIIDFVNIASETASEKGHKLTVYEWWLVSNDFAYAAKDEGEIIVDTPFGAIWGRQHNGPLIAMDLCVESILKAVGAI